MRVSNLEEEERMRHVACAIFSGSCAADASPARSCVLIDHDLR